MKPKHIGIFLIALISSSIMTWAFINSNTQQTVAQSPAVSMPPKKVSKIPDIDTTVWFVREPMEIKVGF